VCPPGHGKLGPTNGSPSTTERNVQTSTTPKAALLTLRGPQFADTIDQRPLPWRLTRHFVGGWCITLHEGAVQTVDVLGALGQDAVCQKSNERSGDTTAGNVNAGEVWYIVARQTSAPDADTSIKQLRDLGIEFVDANWDLAKEPGYFKSKNKMSFADCFVARSRNRKKRIWLRAIPNLSRLNQG
jgi:hypothetical protein